MSDLMAHHELPEPLRSLSARQFARLHREGRLPFAPIRITARRTPVWFSRTAVERYLEDLQAASERGAE